MVHSQEQLILLALCGYVVNLVLKVTLSLFDKWMAQNNFIFSEEALRTRLAMIISP